ncbi:MAG: hypothetical protein IT372_07275 [Polyangiaceae bacterium]|nr:hypothetical protein [Polyangiaceae bacterium]
MLGVVLVMQAAGTPAPPPAPAPQPPAASASAALPGMPTAPAASPPPGYAPYPYYYPYPPPYPYAPPPPVAPPAPPPAQPAPEREVTWFARLELGLGTPGFSEETELLRLEGYGGAKLWATLDGGYLFHPNVGIGAWVGLARWSSSPHDVAPPLSENDYFVGAEVPFKLGTRSISFVGAPRVGFATGQVEIGGDAPFQSAFAYGVEIGVASFRYHIGGSVGILRAAVPPPGELGRDHDLGGFYVVIGGMIDG